MLFHSSNVGCGSTDEICGVGMRTSVFPQTKTHPSCQEVTRAALTAPSCWVITSAPSRMVPLSDGHHVPPMVSQLEEWEWEELVALCRQVAKQCCVSNEAQAGRSWGRAQREIQAVFLHVQPGLGMEPCVVQSPPSSVPALTFPSCSPWEARAFQRR